jgi:hypothetical protein
MPRLSTKTALRDLGAVPFFAGPNRLVERAVGTIRRREWRSDRGAHVEMGGRNEVGRCRR